MIALENVEELKLSVITRERDELQGKLDTVTRERDHLRQVLEDLRQAAEDDYAAAEEEVHDAELEVARREAVRQAAFRARRRVQDLGVWGAA